MSKHSAHSDKINYFQRCWDLGYRNLLPVVPPDGGIPNAGKRPGILVGIGADIRWMGKASRDFVATPDTILAWHAMGASVGLSCNGTGLCGIDIDTLTPRWVEHIAGLAHEMLGPAPARVGRAPKLLLPYNCPLDLRYAQIRFRDDTVRPVTADGRRLAPGLVEVLAGDTKWFVAWGMHPQTRQPYDWPDGMPPRSELTTITLAQRDAFLEQLRSELPDARRQQAGDGEAVDAETLRGDPRLVAAAMRAIPNDPEIIGYDEWRNIGIALRGAIPNYSDGLELFQEWTDRAGISEADATEKAHRVFGSVESARQLGAQYIYDRAERHGWIGRAVERWFVEPGSVEFEAPYESIFGDDAAGIGGRAAVRISATAWEWQDPLTFPPRDFLYGTHIVRRFASMTVAPSKVGKSSLATVDILAMTTGRTLLPRMKPKGKLRVWYINGEDPKEELDRRILAAMLHYRITPADTGGRLFVDSGRSLRLVTAIEDRQGVKILRPIMEALVAELRARAIDVLVVDPFVSTHQVGENDNNGIDMVLTEWIMAADTANCGIDFCHHARKAGVGADPDASIDAARGASAIGAKMRSVRALANMTKAQGKQLGLTTIYRDLFRVTDAASNLAPWVDDETEWLRRESVSLGNGDHVAVVTQWAITNSDAGKADIMVVVQALGGEAWRDDVRAGDEWVGNVVAAALNLDLAEPDDKATVKRLIGKWVKEGVLERVQLLDKNRNKRWYVRARSVFD